MDRKQNLKSFLYQIKDTLPFEDAKDFQEKIINEKEFRIKIQKLAYLSKFSDGTTITNSISTSMAHIHVS